MKATTLRFSDQTHQLITEEAKAEGVSTSAFVREAALARAVWLKAQRGAYNPTDMAELYRRVKAILDTEDGRRR